VALDLTPEEQALAKEIEGCFDLAEDRHRGHRRRWEHFYGLYRSYSQFRDEYDRASPRDRDVGLRDAKGTWGAELFIPYSFSAVETITPRAVSQRPRMLVLPESAAELHRQGHRAGRGQRRVPQVPARPPAGPDRLRPHPPGRPEVRTHLRARGAEVLLAGREGARASRRPVRRCTSASSSTRACGPSRSSTTTTPRTSTSSTCSGTRWATRSGRARGCFTASG
jgi:hypothetical protein